MQVQDVMVDVSPSAGELEKASLASEEDWEVVDDAADSAKSTETPANAVATLDQRVSVAFLSRFKAHDGTC